jgi:hypothetical protein
MSFSVIKILQASVTPHLAVKCVLKTKGLWTCVTLLTFATVITLGELVWAFCFALCAV